MNNLRKDLGKALPSVKTALPNTLASYYEQLKQTRCGDHEFLKHSLQVWKTFTGWRATGKINAAIKCKVCGTSRCAGCQKTHTGASSKLKALGSVSVDYCCNKGLVFILWALLCGLDGVTSNEEVQQSMMEPQNPYGEIGGPYGMGMAWGLPGGPAGVSGKAKGTGYGGTDTFNEILSIKATEMALRNTPEDQKDGIIGDVLAVVTQILSDTDGPTIPLILVFLQASTVLDKVAELLRNDSIKNVTKRHSLYRRVLNFVRVLTKHKLYSAAVLKQRDSKDDGATLFSITQGKKGFNVSERSPPISSYFKNLSTQALVIIKAAKLTPREYSSENGQMQVLLCNQIVELGRSFQPNQTSKDLMQKAPTYEPLAKYHKEHCAEEIDDRVIMQNHSLYLRMRSVPQPPPIQGRMKRLVEEIANMKTSLPPGIFIRYASTRPDILKALIIGPADTPYENGLFEFDILCPTNYPLNPPLVILRTTGGGRVSFNPNLYADGKVCLSILGTYPGQPWIRDQSTILQVLVSIQSMILSDKPLYNEPGYDFVPNVALHSRRYDAKIHATTIYHAMIEWMQNVESSIWKPIVIKHFVEAAPKIMGISKRWSDEAQSLLRVIPGGLQNSNHFHGALNDAQHTNPYTAHHLRAAYQHVNGVISQFLKGYGRH